MKGNEKTVRVGMMPKKDRKTTMGRCGFIRLSSILLTFAAVLSLGVVAPGCCKDDSFCRLPSTDTKRMYETNIRYEIGNSEVVAFPGHWPSGYCKLTDVYLKTSEKTFHVGFEDPSSIDVCFGTRHIWQFRSKSDSISNGQTRFHCDQVYEVGHVFTMYYYHGSNYFHLHYDTALPLYRSLWHDTRSYDPTSKNTVLMPSVELERLKGINWETDAFFNGSTYWNKLIQVIADPYQLLPLDKRLAAMDKTLCFKEIRFGSPKVNVSDSKIVRSFVSFVKSRLNVGSVSIGKHKRLGLIQRKARRKILNYYQLVDALKPFVNVKIVDFSGHSLETQVEMMQEFDILAGINGAGLMNAIYLPEKSVAVQMVPYGAQLNHVEYRKLLQARGPYMEWHNMHSELNRAVIDDKFNNNGDTIVQIDEFVELIKEALRLINDH